MLELFYGAMPPGFLDRVGAAALKQQLYLALVAQQLQMTGQIWQWRSGAANWGEDPLETITEEDSAPHPLDTSSQNPTPLVVASRRRPLLGRE